MKNNWVLEEALRRDKVWSKTRWASGSGAASPAKAVIKREVQAEVKSVDEATRTIWHKITAEVRDRMGDIIRIDGIDTTAFRAKPGVLYGHDYRSMNPIPVIAENVGFIRDGAALYAGTKFLSPGEVSRPLADLVNDLWLLNKKKLMGWSVGFIPREQRDIVEGGKVTGQDYTKSELLEYSNVIIPAHQDAVNDAISRGLVTKALTGYEAKLAPEGPVFYYELVDERTIDGHAVAAANDMLGFCMRKLKIPHLDLAWYRIVDAGTPGAKILGPRRSKAFVQVGGDRDPRVHLRADLSAFDLQFAAAHECHHTWMESQPPGRYASLDADDREGSANGFAWMMWQELRDLRRTAE